MTSKLISNNLVEAYRVKGFLFTGYDSLSVVSIAKIASENFIRHASILYTEALVAVSVVDNNYYLINALHSSSEPTVKPGQYTKMNLITSYDF